MIITARFLLGQSKKDRKAQITGFGGPVMSDAGVDVKIELTRFALVGFAEVAKKYSA